MECMDYIATGELIRLLRRAATFVVLIFTTMAYIIILYDDRKKITFKGFSKGALRVLAFSFAVHIAAWLMIR